MYKLNLALNNLEWHKNKPPTPKAKVTLSIE